MERGAERQVVDLGELLVDAFNEVVLDGGDRQGAGADIGSEIIFALEQGHRGSSLWARLPGLNPDLTRGRSVWTVARNLFDWLNFRHDTRQDTRGLPFGTIQGLPDPDKHCLHEVNKQRRCGCSLRSCRVHRVMRVPDRNGQRWDHITPWTRLRSAARSRLQSRRLLPQPPRRSGARRMRSSISDGTRTPGTSFARYSASSTLSNGRTLRTTGRPAASSRRRICSNDRDVEHGSRDRRTPPPLRPCTRTAASRSSRSSARRD